MSKPQLSYKSMKTRHSFAMRSLLVLTGSLVAFAVVSATPAFAEDESPASPPAGDEAVGTDGAGAPPPAAPPPAAPPAAATHESLEPGPISAQPAAQPAAATEVAITAVGIERLKASAFPGQTRGIKGGSLALTFHGLQWPYMPSPSGGSRFVLGLSGWVWDDISYVKYKPSDTNSNKKQMDQKKAINQGRYVLRATPTWTSGDWFVQGQGEFVATTNQGIDRKEYGGADTDDLWLRVGMWNLFDVQVGRFEGWEVFHLGMGLDLNTYERRGALDDGYPVEFYGLTDMQYRSNAAGNVAFHLYPMDILRFEILGQAGSTTAQNSFGGRAVGILDMGWFKLKGGAEYRKQTDMKASANGRAVSKGYGFSAQFIPHPWIECGLNFAEGYVSVFDSDAQGPQRNLKGSFDRRSYGGFLNGRLYFEDLILGLGVINTTKLDMQTATNNPGAYDDLSHLQSFMALQYAVFKQFYIKVVGSYAKSDIAVPRNLSNNVESEQERYTKSDFKSYSVRVRFSFFY
jgi:hypothetical protein